MSSVKRGLAEQDTQHEVAVVIALRVGLLVQCETCDDIYDPLENNHDDAYKLANSLITAGDPIVDKFATDRRALTDLLKDITVVFGQDCKCKHQLAKD